MENSNQVTTKEYNDLVNSYEKLKSRLNSLENKEFADYYNHDDNQEILKLEKELHQKHSQELIKSHNSGWLKGINYLSKLQKEEIEEIIEMSYKQGFNDCKTVMFYPFTQHIGWGNYRRHWGKMSESYGDAVKKTKIPILKKKLTKLQNYKINHPGLSSVSPVVTKSVKESKKQTVEVIANDSDSECVTKRDHDHDVVCIKRFDVSGTNGTKSFGSVTGHGGAKVTSINSLSSKPVGVTEGKPAPAFSFGQVQPGFTSDGSAPLSFTDFGKSSVFSSHIPQDSFSFGIKNPQEIRDNTCRDDDANSISGVRDPLLSGCEYPRDWV